MDRSRPRAASNRQISDEAADWFVEFSTGEPSDQERRVFDAWLRKSPEHVCAYLELFSIWEDASLVDAGRAASADELVALCRDGSSTVVSLHAADASNPSGPAREAAQPVRRTRSAAAWTMAAALLMSLSILFGWYGFQRDTYTTDIGEQRIIALADGSTIELNARSRIRVQIRDAERRVDLLTGQALFRVAKDAHRPFIVASGDTQVRAVGTQFDVHKRRTGTTVTVVEGRVAVVLASTRPVADAVATSTEYPAAATEHNGGAAAPREHGLTNDVLGQCA